MPLPDKLTVYNLKTNKESVVTSKFINKKLSNDGATQWDIKHNYFLAINLFLIGIVALSLLFYILETNAITSSNFKISSLNDQMSGLNEIHSSLVVKQNTAQSTSEVINFVVSNNMVESKDVAYMYDDGSVALKR